MQKETAQQFLHKEISFKKEGLDKTLVGFLVNVTDTEILIKFNGRLQSHKLDLIYDMEEALDG